MREQRAQAILSRWNELVYHEPAADSDRELYYFSSDRAPSCPFPGFGGCWTVAVRKPPKPPDLPPIPPPPPLPLPGGATSFPANTTFIFNLNTNSPGLPPRIQSANSIAIAAPGYQDIEFPWLTGEVYVGDPPDDILFGPNGPVIETMAVLAGDPPVVVDPGDYEGQTIAQLNAAGVGYWVRAIKQYVFPDEVMQLVLYRWVRNQAEPRNAYTGSAYQYEAPPDGDTPLVISAETEYAPAYPPGYDAGNPPPDGAIPDYDPTPPPEEPDLDAPSPDDQQDQAEYECNCPDAAMTWGGDNETEEDGDRYERDWRGSEAGAPMDSQGLRLCKHVIATKMYRGEW